MGLFSVRQYEDGPVSKLSVLAEHADEDGPFRLLDAASEGSVSFSTHIYREGVSE